MDSLAEFTECLQLFMKQLSLDLPKTAASNSFAHYETLKVWMHETNLISKNATPEEIVQNHYADSLAAFGLIRSDNVIDLGSGAGFPGWPLAGAYLDKSFLLVEPRRKRVSFLEAATAHAGLKNVKVQMAKIERAILPSTSYDLVHRAVFPPNELWEKIKTGTFKPVTIITWSMIDYVDENNKGAQRAGYKLLAERPLPWSERRVLLCYGR